MLIQFIPYQSKLFKVGYTLAILSMLLPFFTDIAGLFVLFGALVMLCVIAIIEHINGLKSPYSFVYTLFLLSATFFTYHKYTHLWDTYIFAIFFFGSFLTMFLWGNFGSIPNRYSFKPWQNIVFALGSITVILGAMFKIMHWPYANLMLATGIAVSLAIDIWSLWTTSADALD